MTMPATPEPANSISAFPASGEKASSGGASLWQFCDVCGTILSFPDSGEITCTRCGSRPEWLNKEGWSEEIVIVTRSASRPVPDWIRQLRETENAGPKATTRATVQETCPKCGAKEMEFYTLQLRSADEGQTVFYECTNGACRHTFSLNN